MIKPCAHAVFAWVLATANVVAGDPPDDLRVGVAQHAFDHLGGIGEQAASAAASGATVIYATGCGALGYAGLPPAPALTEVASQAAAYNKLARAEGVRVILGYVCATSIVNLDSFDKNWSPEFRDKFHTPPHEWRQQDVHGQPLPSWYGGQYHPGCMNNPDWREYEKFIVRQQLDSGHDGVFFDNPTVHPQGCYCKHCMRKFSDMLEQDGVISAAVSVEEARQHAAKHPAHFLRLRGGVARDFLQFMRAYVRSVRPQGLVTCNNSLNAPDRLYAQCRTHGYNIYEMSKAQDLVVVEDMATQPRLLPGGQTVEYGSTLAQLQAISHGLPVVANVLAEADYHTPPNLVRLAMAEAAAHGASYLSWPTWPAEQRDRMARAIRPQADLLQENSQFLNDAQPRRDVILFLPFRRWTETTRCIPSELAARLTAANVQYGVVSEDDVIAAVALQAVKQPADPRGTAAGALARQVFLVESRAVLRPAEAAALEKFEASGGLVVAADEADWMKRVQSALRPSLEIDGPTTVRAVIRDQPDRTIVHLYNLAIERLSSFEDRVHPASDVKLRIRVPMDQVQAVTAITADHEATRGAVPFEATPDNGSAVVQATLPRVDVSTILVIE